MGRCLGWGQRGALLGTQGEQIAVVITGADQGMALSLLQNPENVLNYFCQKGKNELRTSPKGRKIKVSKQELDARP